MSSPSSPSQPPIDVRDLMRSLAIILAFNLIGLLLSKTLIPLPGAVIGLCLLATALFTGLIKVEWVESGASLLLQSMMLFFVPALVGALDLLPILGRHTFAFLLATIGSLIAVMLATGFTTKWLIRHPSPPAKPSADPSSKAA